MSQKLENINFSCENCGKKIERLTNGSFRNHCPYCLYSKHVDVSPGDRMNECQGLMKPIGLKFKSSKGFQLVHQCVVCDGISVNKIAEATVQSDDVDVYSRLPML